MGDIFDDLNSDDQTITHDAIEEVMVNEYFSLVVQPHDGKVSIHLETEMGDVTPVGLYLPENKTVIQQEINNLLTK